VAIVAETVETRIAAMVAELRRHMLFSTDKPMLFTGKYGSAAPYKYNLWYEQWQKYAVSHKYLCHFYCFF